jgi:hypothetical protein
MPKYPRKAKAATFRRAAAKRCKISGGAASHSRAHVQQEISKLVEMNEKRLDELMETPDSYPRLPEHLERKYREISAGKLGPHSHTEMLSYLSELIPVDPSGRIDVEDADAKAVFDYLKATGARTVRLG